jgi:hypothetical protein
MRITPLRRDSCKDFETVCPTVASESANMPRTCGSWKGRTSATGLSQGVISVPWGFILSFAKTPSGSETSRFFTFAAQ